jgi:broad specificity phosphatase PhoE
LFLNSLLGREETRNKECILAVAHGGIIHGLLLFKTKTKKEKINAISTIIENTDTVQIEIFEKMEN